MGRIVAVVALTLVVSAMTTRLISIRTNAAEMIPLSVLLDEYRREGAFSPDNTRRAKESDLEAFEKFLAESLQVRFSNARLGDISDDFRFLDVVGKGGKRRIVPIVPALLSELNLYMRWRYQWTTRPEYPLLLSKTAATRNKPESWRVNSKTLWRDVHDAAVDVGIENHLAHPHALRHTFARRSLAHLSLIYGAAEALNILRLTMGHSTINTTMLYLTEGREALFNALAEVA